MARRVLAVALLFAIGLAADARGQAVSIQADAAHTGNAAGALLHPPLRRAWSRSLPGRVSYPVVADGRAFVIRQRPWPTGSEVVALAIRTGRVLWRHDLGAEATAGGVAVGGGKVVVTRESYYDPGDPSGVLALAPADGRVLWEQGTGLFDGQPPVIHGDRVFVNGLNQVGVTALSLADGAVLWRAQTESGDGGAPAVGGDGVYAAMSSCPDIYRFARGDGAPVWHPVNDCHGGGGSVPVLYGGRLYVHTESDRWPPGDVYDAATGAITGPMRADLSPAFAGNTGVFPDARRPLEDAAQFGHTLVARNVRTGRVRWTFRGDGYLDSAPLIAGRRVYVGSGSGRLFAADLRTGRRVWRTRPGPPIPAPTNALTMSGLAAAEGTLLVPSLGRLTAYR
jgi:outer membrane protein assembly factor BamB